MADKIIYNSEFPNGKEVSFTPEEKTIQEAKVLSSIEEKGIRDAQAYARNRATEFPAISEQLDMLFHDMTAGKGSKTGEWYKAIAKVKADNPKG